MAEYIDRNELIKRLETSISSWGRDCNSNAPTMVRAYQDVLHRVKSIPAADVVEVRHGKWDYDISDVGWTDYSCSVCRNITTVEGQNEDLYSFCPYCGAKMDGKVGAEK